MNSLNYLSRQLDILAASSTPPSTPLTDTHANGPERPQRAKSYSRIFTGRSSHHGHHGQGHHHQPHHGQHRGEETPSNLGHASKRSFSSPALWSFRKPTLTPTSSIPSTPVPILKRTTSYGFIKDKEPEPISTSTSTSAPDPNAQDSTEPSTSTPVSTSSLLIRILWSIWDAFYAIWLSISGYLVVPIQLSRPGRGRGQGLGQEPAQALDKPKDNNEGDSSDEKEDTEDDGLGIVTRAPKRSLQGRHKDTQALALVSSSQAFQMSSTNTTTTTTIQEVDQEDFIFSTDPPSPEEVQARTETPRIDLIPPTPRARTPSPTTAAGLSHINSSNRKKPDQSPSLLPNPLSSSLLTKASTVVSAAGSTFTFLQQQQDYAGQPNPPRKMPGLHMQKTLVLDLDETLIHSSSRPLRAHAGGGLLSMGGFGFGFGEKRGREAGHMVEVVLGGRCTLYHVYKRPFLDFFLRKVSSWYTLVIFTASMQEYADPVIDWLDAGRGILGRRLFRESCTQLPNGSYTKDLSLIEQDLSRVCLIDNSPVSYNVNPANGIPIEGWISDPSDEALLHLLPVLDSLRFATDVRRILGIRLFN